MTTFFPLIQLARSDKENCNILDGKLDRQIQDRLSLKSSSNAAKKRGRKRKNMATTINSPAQGQVSENETEKTWLELVKSNKSKTVGVVETPYGFKLRPDGEYTAKKSVFDIDKLERVTEEKKYKVDNITNVEQLDALPLDQKLALVNLGLQRQNLLAAKSEITGYNAKAINTFINSLRFMVQFKAIKDRGEQTKAIMDYVRKTAGMMEALKAMGSEPETSDSEDDEDGE